VQIHLDWRGKSIIWLAALAVILVGLPATVAFATKSTPTVSTATWETSTDGQKIIKVYELETKTVVSMPLNDYVENVLAAQISATAPMASLQAVAIAARTYAIYAIQRGDLQTAPSASTAPNIAATFAQQHGADVTDNGTLDLPWLTTAMQIERFGQVVPSARVRLQQAVASTDGIILTYQQQPILAFMFPESPGKTRSAAIALHKNLPYLQVVACPADVIASNHTHTYRFTAAQVEESLGISQTSWQQAQITVTRSVDGFVDVVTVGDKSYTGNAIATRLNLPSTDYQLTKTQSLSLAVTVEGVGTDIGLSLHEAVILGQHGKRVADILGTFYPSAKLESTENY